MQKGGISKVREAFLFQPIPSSKSNKLRDSGCLTYSRMREHLKAKSEELGFPSAEIDLHNLRAEAQQQQPGQRSLIEIFSNMAAGSQRV